MGIHTKHGPPVQWSGSPRHEPTGKARGAPLKAFELADEVAQWLTAFSLQSKPPK